MSRKSWVLGLAVLLCLATPVTSALAGAKVEIDEHSKIDLGFRLQTLYRHTEKDIDNDGRFESVDDFLVRRARIRLGADITQWVGVFLQTEFVEDGDTGGDVRLIDAFGVVKLHPMAQFYIGENMAPVMRQNLTSSGALMAIDRPAITYKNLTWGTRARYAFTTENFDDGDAGLRGSVDVRDMGLTLFGSAPLSETMHLKYYLGTYDGVQEAGQDEERYVARVQVNLFDPEPEYYNLSTYLGKKKTLAIGAAVDFQDDVARELATGRKVDYEFYTFDIFADYPVGPGYLTFEAAWIELDLDDAGAISPAPSATADQAEGDGWYAQAGYFLNNWQPWIAYEEWDGDGPGGRGSFDVFRVGITYFILGHNANIKLGYEYFDAEEDLVGTSEDRVETLVAGLYVTY